MTDPAAATIPVRPGRPLSLASRLSGAIGFILLIGGLIVTWAAFAYGQQAARNAFDRLLIGAADQISASISIVDGQPLVDLPVTALDLLALAEDDRIVYRVADATGKTLTGYENVTPPRDSGDVVFYDGTFTGEPIRLVAVRRHFAERGFSGSITTIVGHTLLARNALAWEITRNAWIALGIAGIGMVLLAAFAIRSALAPLRRVEHEMLKRDPKDLTPFDIAVPAELSAVMTAINGFMLRLKRQMDAMQNLISDSAHQLRTPIAGLRAQAELAAEETDAVRQREIVRRVHARAVGLSRLTDQMLNRALVAHRADTAIHTVLDLRKIAMAATEMFDDGTMFESGRLKLDVPASPVLIRGDALSLTEAVKNLISNAIQHGEGNITIAVSPKADRADLLVWDQGEGLTKSQESQLGERFATTDKTSRGGAGIGLSIARAVARAHHSDIVVNRAGSKAFGIGFSLPRLTEPEAA